MTISGMMAARGSGVAVGTGAIGSSVGGGMVDVPTSTVASSRDLFAAQPPSAAAASVTPVTPRNSLRVRKFLFGFIIHSNIEFRPVIGPFKGEWATQRQGVKNVNKSIWLPDPFVML
jgi:hypothetical protein